MNEESESAGRKPVIATYNAQITLRGTGSAPTIEEVQSAVESALQGLTGVSRASQPLTSVNVRASRTDA